MLPPPPTFDVPGLLQSSQPRGRGVWFIYSLGLFLLLVVMGLAFGSQAGIGSAVQAMTGLAILGLILVSGALSWRASRAMLQEQNALTHIEELVQLRRWDQAAWMLGELLSRPMQSPAGRAQALVFLTAVLARFNRFGDAIDVFDHLLDSADMDPAGAHALRLGRAMSLLRDDRLLDADRAISQLRREEPAGGSAGLALVELYRDVKTGHPKEAIEIFTQRRDGMRRQLGHRLADGLALAARAQEMLGNTAEAARLYDDATVLAPEVELHRRYPELAAMAGKHAAAAAPGEAP